MAEVVVFDLETQRSIDEVGGRGNIHRLGLAAAVIYSTEDGGYRHYTEETAADLIAQLRAAPLVVGFNLYRFDYIVLGAYGNTGLSELPTVDMLDYLHRRLGFRVSLDNLTTSTLGSSKSADGLDAIRWFRQGQLDKVLEYCQQDVDLTYRLYEFGRHNKYVEFRERNRALRRVSVDW